MKAVFKQLNPCSNHEICVLFEHGFYLKILKTDQVCLHEVMRQNIAAQNAHFVYAFVDVNIASGNDIFDMRFCMLTPSCTKRSNVRDMIILMFFSHFWCNFSLESGKMQE